MSWHTDDQGRIYPTGTKSAIVYHTHIHTTIKESGVEKERKRRVINVASGVHLGAYRWACPRTLFSYSPLF